MCRLGDAESASPFAVPELTRSAPIKLNKRVSLRKRANCIRLLYRTLPQRPASRSRQSRQAGDHIPLGGFVLHSPKELSKDHGKSGS
jgi:hypothetical protein